MDWGTIFSGVSAAGSVVAAIAASIAASTGISVYRFTKRSADKIAAEQDLKRWRIDLEWLPPLQAGRRETLIAQIRYDRNGPPVRVLSLTAKSPSFLRLASFNIETTQVADGQRYKRPVLIAPGLRRSLRLCIDYDESSVRAAFFDVLLSVPPRPLWTYLSRRTSVTLRISVKFEERDAARRRRKITVKSAAMPWSVIAPEANARKNADGTWSMPEP